MGRRSASAGAIRVVAFAVTSLLGSVATHAASAPRDSRPVEIVFAGKEPDVLAVRRIVRELLERDGVVVHTSRTDSIEATTVLSDHGGSAAVYIWIDLRRRREARLFLTSSDGERIVIRRVRLADGLDELGREAIGQIVESSVLALASGVQVGMSRDEAQRVMNTEEPDPPKPAVSAADRHAAGSAAPSAAGGSQPASAAGGSGQPRTAPVTYRVGLGYGAAAFLPGAVVEHGPLLGAAVGSKRGSPRLALEVTGQYRVPVSASTGEVTLTFNGASFRLEAGSEFWIGEQAWFGALAGAGLDVIRVVPERAAEPALALAPAAVFVNGAARATVLAGRRVWPSLAVSVSAFADISLTRTHYDVHLRGVTFPTLTPWPVRPGLSLALWLLPEPTRNALPAMTSPER
ncbi:MAG: hypothetical protein JW940_06285 [Polyangiaceae bacterium]|nr:hypothetical protein [Polyangiaceae bacterium]